MLTKSVLKTRHEQSLVLDLRTNSKSIRTLPEGLLKAKKHGYYKNMPYPYLIKIHQNKMRSALDRYLNYSFISWIQHKYGTIQHKHSVTWHRYDMAIASICLGVII